jgi:alpha-D-ribose 1-methylphosphonate 5-triphosphate synthase subunit PhnG
MQGCRCDECRAANAAYEAGRRRRSQNACAVDDAILQLARHQEKITAEHGPALRAFADLAEGSAGATA